MNQLKIKNFILLYEKYDVFIKARNYKGKNRYNSAVLEFLLWLESKGIESIRQVKQRHLHSYFEYIVSRANKKFEGVLSESSIKNHLFAINLFYENMLFAGDIQKSYIFPAFNNAHKKNRNILSNEEIKLVYQHCESLQERCLIHIAYGCGLRRNEIFCLNIQDIQLPSGFIIVREGKNGKRREVPISSSLINDFQEYIFNERTTHTPFCKRNEKAFFINKKGGRMSGDYLNRMIKKIILRTDNFELINKEISLHCLRHSISTHLIDNGAGIEFVRDFLGHQEIDTTQLYIIRRKRNQIKII